MLRIGRGLRIRLSMPRWLSRAWGPGSLRWNAAYWWLRGWRSRWSPCRVSALRKAKGHSSLRRWNGHLGLGGLRWILRMGGSWPLHARYWGVGIASSNARRGWNGARGVGHLFKWLAVGRPLERKLMVAWASQGGGGFRKVKMGLWNEYRALVPLNRSLSDFWNSQGCEMSVRVAKCVRKPSQISQGILGVRNEFT